MSRPRSALVVSDDIPVAYLRRLLGHRLDRDSPVFSRVDALRKAEAEHRRNPKHHHPHGRPRRGRADR